jgi:hypothetical protein
VSPGNADNLVKFRPELLKNWERARSYEPLERIPGLDAD